MGSFLPAHFQGLWRQLRSTSSSLSPPLLPFTYYKAFYFKAKKPTPFSSSFAAFFPLSPWPKHPGGSHIQVRRELPTALSASTVQSRGQHHAALGGFTEGSASASSDVGVELPVILMHPKPADGE